jgi:Kef-type K+ transport system membrane component KefB
MSRLLAAVISVHRTEQTVYFTLLQLIVILIAARAAGTVARWLKQPRVVGEIVGGLVIGQSVFGRLFPGAFDYVFHSSPPEPLLMLSQIGLILLMFQIGLEFDFSHLKDKQNRAAMFSISAAGIVLPFGLGWLLADWSHAQLAPEINPLGYRLFMAVAMSITAIPILGRIMMELDLTRTRMGVVAITAAAMDDVTGWVLLAIVSALTTAEFSGAMFGVKVGLLVAYVAACLLVVRPLLRRLVHRFGVKPDHLPHTLMAALIAVIFASGLVTYTLGVFAIFGGFMMGVLLHDHHEFVAAWKKYVAQFVTVFFLPIFFTFTGLRTNVNALDSLALWGWCGAIVAVATVGKFCGCTAAARIWRLSWAEASCIGILMNTRGLMELIVVNVGFELGVIPPNVFTMLVLMAITSTVITAPLLRHNLERMGHVIPVNRDV